MTNSASAETIGTAAEAERIIDSLNAIMDRLIATVESETAHMRKGRVRDALALEAQKQELAARYAAETGRVRVSQTMIAKSLPQALAKLRDRHAAFQSLLQTNLTVVATAHAVSEGIIRGVSGELARKQTPSTYGAGGRTNAPSPRAGQPLAISRTL